MATKDTVQILDALVKDAKRVLHQIPGDEKLSENTKRTKTHNIRHEIKRLYVIKSLLSVTTDEKLAKLNEDKVFSEALYSILNPSDGGTKVQVKEGDNIMHLMFHVYNGSKNIAERLNKAADKVGLKIDVATGTFVRK